ncbi:taste receptor type 2 member 4-like [Leptodactylus fuscus]|uniref:taste receptor type 2 member 4-like n=1 Tax=Leptodactylus fuscus TaxID=238119 RepID=UPI003F4E4E1C
MDTEKNPFNYIIIVTVVISFPGNIFIIVVNILDFCRNRRLPRSDQLIFGFSVFNLLQGLLDFFQSAIAEINADIPNVYMFLNMCIILFSTLLSIHFCLKIVNINHWFYVGLQRAFPKLFPWPLILFVLGYFILSLYSTLDPNQNCQLNATSIDFSVSALLTCSWTTLIVIIHCGLSTILCSVAALTILISLFRHMKRIRENAAGSRPPNMEAHISAGTKKLDNVLKWILSQRSIFTSKNK